jgi:hypothetical protein
MCSREHITKVLGSFPKMNGSKRITWQKYLDIFLKLMHPKKSTWVKWVIFMDNCECTNVSRSSPNSRSPYLAHMAIDVYEHKNES